MSQNIDTLKWEGVYEKLHNFYGVKPMYENTLK
uniref:Uncharacterized protein n=1 Tax=Anguilla anguilla TaxID=7936 RepID=A0A0E9WDR6_ANGAN